jgi:hypothetical protein
MADLPDPCKQLVHTIRSNPVNLAERAAAEAEIRMLLTHEQITSATTMANAATATAKSLKRATWVLSFATVVLALATIILVFVTASA